MAALRVRNLFGRSDRNLSRCGCNKRGRNRITLPLNGTDESVTAAGHGFDIPRRIGGVAQGASELVHRGVNTMLEIDKRLVAPDLLPQLLTSDEFPRLGKQRQENLARLPGQANAQAALAQLARENIHFKRSECDPALDVVYAWHRVVRQ